MFKRGPLRQSLSAHTSTSRDARRTLRLDALEDRRVLAGIDVLVFDDLLGNRATADQEHGIAGIVAYLDLNRNSLHDAGEPTSITGVDGVAKFRSLPRGEYSISLLGQSESLIQTTPVGPALEGTWKPWDENSPFGSDDEVALLATSGDRWIGHSDDRILFGKSSAMAETDSVLVNGSIREIVFRFSNRENGRGLASVERAGTRTLVAIDWSEIGGLQLRDLDVGGLDNLHSLAALESSFVGVDASGDLVEIGLDGKLKTWDLRLAGDAPEVKAFGRNSIAVKESTTAGDRISVYNRLDGELVLEAERTFASTIEEWKGSAAGGRIYTKVENLVYVLDSSSTLPTVTTLSGSSFPVLEDAQRGLLYTAPVHPSDAWGVWSTQSWERVASLAIPAELSVQSLALEATGDSIVALNESGLFELQLTAPKSIEIDLREAIASVAIGIRQASVNVGPELNGRFEYSLEEDTDFQISLDDFAQHVHWPEHSGNHGSTSSLYWVIIDAPKLGTLQWAAGTGGRYVPNVNAEGTDTFRLAAYDGRSLSNAVVVTLGIQSVNDEPTDVRFEDPTIAEDIQPKSFVTHVEVDDPDTDDVYDFLLSDPRFTIVGTALYFLGGTIDYEYESYIPIFVTAVNRNVPSDMVQRTLTLNVKDKNDPPTDLLFGGELSIPEMTPGYLVGSVSVVDQDSFNEYNWTVSDRRFEVVGGILKLKKNFELDFETESTVTLTVTARDRSTTASYSRSLAFAVLDLDDPALSMTLSAEYEVLEKRYGASIGYVYVHDADAGEEYDFTVNDSRFEVVQNLFRLKRGESLLYGEPGYVDLTITALSRESGVQISKNTRVNVLENLTPFHNGTNPADVNNDGVVTPLDPLIIINHLNEHGPGAIFMEGEGPINCIDVNGDGVISPLDVLIVINIINSANSNPFGGGSNGGGKIPVEDEPGGDVAPDIPLLAGEGEGGGGTLYFASYFWSSESNEWVAGRKRMLTA